MADGNGELRGVIRGRIIELEAETGLPDGASVTVQLKDRRRELSDEERRASLLRAAGGWAGDDEVGLDEYLRQCREDRQASRPEIDA